ncbi:hypothetical protein NW762_003195 [Fusarium torreyae]|uniref:alpha-L-fucosidase n=1 Tax=Fusarium torreyae TaxID=1237075 RepID=A0A9W8VIU8_9HYPO|nr:hypothetical protein NW762_003195 [Fusarium torreyae]
MFPKAAAVAAAAYVLFPFNAAAQGSGPYTATWESTDTHKASPEWFRDAKFGVYWHWGAFTTPQYSSEWYPRNMYNPKDGVYRHHTEIYGPPEEWGYQNFIRGAKDRKGNFVQFKPVLTSDGGKFDPEALLSVVKASGARFAGPVGEHHDGYSMWDSKVNEWNSVKLGPRLDLVKMWADLVRKNGMKLVVAMHQAYNSNGYFEYAPRANNTSLQKLLGQLPRDEEDTLWFEKHREMLDHVQPDIIWNDFKLDAISEQKRLDFLAYYFNRGVDWRKEVLTTHKRDDLGFRDTSSVADFERGGPANITRPYWLTDDALSASSWSYTNGMKYYSSKSMIHSLLDRISKNGNLLLNISPTAAGVLPDPQVQILRDIGKYLSRYGESVYSTRAWDIYGEGPTKAGGGSFTKPVEGTNKDVRFTRNKDGNVLYVTILGWPDNGQVSLGSLGKDALVDLDTLESIKLLGDKSGDYLEVTNWKQNKNALNISLAVRPVESPAYVLKLRFDGKIPVPQPKIGATVWYPTKTDGPGVTLGEGSFDEVFLTEAGITPKDIAFIRVSPNTKLTLYTNENLSGATKQLGPGEHSVRQGTVGSIGIIKG